MKVEIAGEQTFQPIRLSILLETKEEAETFIDILDSLQTSSGHVLASSVKESERFSRRRAMVSDLRVAIHNYYRL